MAYLALYGDDEGSQALVYDDGRVAKLVYGPPLTYDDVGRSGFLSALADIAAQVLDAYPGGFDKLAIGFAGMPRSKEDLIVVAARVFKAKRVAVLSQVHAYYYAVTCGGDGIVLASDTGSFAYGVYNGTKAGAGGWGWLFDDEGGAYWVAREGLRRAFLYIDGRSKDGRHLASSVLARLGVSDPLSAVRKLYAEYASPSRLAGLAGIVCGAAEDGDPAALDVIREASFHLASLAESVYKRLGTPKIPVTGVGRFLVRCKILREETSALLMSLGMLMRHMDVNSVGGCLAYLLSREDVDCREVLSSIPPRGGGG